MKYTPCTVKDGGGFIPARVDELGNVQRRPLFIQHGMGQASGFTYEHIAFAMAESFARADNAWLEGQVK